MVYDKIPKKKPIQQPSPPIQQPTYHPPPPPPQTQPLPPQNKNWPESLIRFVGRAFDTVKNNKIQKLSKKNFETKIL
jgi:hypothetical protein